MFIVALRTNRHRFSKQLRISYDESLNRFMGLESQRKLRYADDNPGPQRHLKGFITLCIRCMTGKPVISGYITPEPELSTIPCMT